MMWGDTLPSDGSVCRRQEVIENMGLMKVKILPTVISTLLRRSRSLPSMNKTGWSLEIYLTVGH